ncbi:hypothetical protein [Edaphocola aurantiacus]|uniref:hypothetical protein n=1 Tax=Edaphocola aurantiacus TaxID=2601682 RepID=UPI001C94C279|nr:hypothetical protein [Edaphocola aurantiacus]
MTKRKAKRILRGQINQLSNCENIGHHWLATLSLLGEIFGKDSEEYQSIFGIKTSSIESEYYKATLTSLLRMFIITVDGKGVYRKGNFLSRMSEGWLIFLISTIIPGVYTLGYWTKSYEKSSEKQSVVIEKKPFISHN